MFALIITMVACKEVNTDPTPTTAATTTQAPTTAGSVTTTDSTTASTATTAGTIAPASTATTAGTIAPASTATSASTSPADTTTATTTWTYMEWIGSTAPSLEPDRQDLPTYAELCEIRVGMTVDEVVALVGNPTREIVDPIDYRITYVFDSCDGDSVGVKFIGRAESDGGYFRVERIRTISK